MIERKKRRARTGKFHPVWESQVSMNGKRIKRLSIGPFGSRREAMKDAKQMAKGLKKQMPKMKIKASAEEILVRTRKPPPWA